MVSQVVMGKAFEWVTALAFSDQLDVEISETPEAVFASACLEKIPTKRRDEFVQAAQFAVLHILEKEQNSPTIQRATSIRVASDAEGQRGDVRDVIVSSLNSELGISCKSNHEAFKHPRLSDRLDFLKSWGIVSEGCSDTYWSAIKPIFRELRDIRAASDGKALWQDLHDYENRFYYPVLDAFQAELWRVTSKDSDSSGPHTVALLSYIVGKHDFYKVVGTSRQVRIQGFNFGGSLSVAKPKYPSFIVAIDNFDGGPNSRTIRFQGGMTFNFRIHSASSRVEPSLKFDVQALSLPPSLVYSHHQSI